MPTARPRYMLTGSDDLEATLDRARQRWPEDQDRPTRLLLRLIDAGDATFRTEDEDALRERLAAIERTSGIFDDVYPPGHLEALREEWPE